MSFPSLSLSLLPYYLHFSFTKIQEHTGITDIDTLVDQFIESEDRNFQLYQHVSSLSKETQKVEKDIARLKSVFFCCCISGNKCDNSTLLAPPAPLPIASSRNEIEKYRGQGANADNQRKRILKDLEKKLAETNDKADQLENKHQDSLRTVGQLKSCIQSLFEKIGCQNSAGQEMLGDGGVTESNMMQYLGIIEQRTNEILQMFRACQVGVRFGGLQPQSVDPRLTATGDSHAPQAGMSPGSPSHGDTSSSSTFSALLMPPVPVQPHGTLKISIEPPEFEEDQDGDEGYDDVGMDDDVGCLGLGRSCLGLGQSSHLPQHRN